MSFADRVPNVIRLMISLMMVIGNVSIELMNLSSDKWKEIERI